MAPTYAQHLPPSVREHTQNWRDQVVTIALQQWEQSSPSSSFQPGRDIHLLYHTTEGSPPRVRWALCSLGVTFGVLLHEPRCLTFINFHTTLSLDILMLGYTTKMEGNTHRPWMAGRFGEGVKVEINRLLQHNSRLTYWTGQERWDFTCAPQAPNARPELCVVQQLFQRPPSSPTVIRIETVPPNAFIPEHYVFLTPSMTSLSSVDGLYTVYLDDNLKGRIYLHGIYVRSLPAHYGFAIDYHGTADVEIGRDRDHASLSWFCVRTHLVVTTEALQSKLGIILEYVRRLYDVLQREDTSFSDFCPSPCDSPGTLLNLSNLLVEEFGRRFPGGCAIPVDSHSPRTEDDARLLGSQVVHVPPLLMMYFRRTPQCPTIEQLWVNRSRDVLSLPEYITGEESVPYIVSEVKHLQGSHAEWALSLRTMVGEFFAPEVAPHHIRFKEFPEANARPIVPVDIPGMRVYCVDVRHLDTSMAHATALAQDPTFVCPGGKCGCVRLTLLEEMMNFFPKEKRRMVEMRLCRTLLGYYQENPLAQPSSASTALPPRLPPAPLTSQVPSFTSQFYLHDDSVADMCLRRVSEEVSDSIRHKGAVHYERCTEEATSTFYLARTPLGLWVDPSRAESVPSEDLAALPPFTAMIQELLENIFGLCNSPNIYWEESNRIAFNRGGVLYFNLRYAVEMHKHRQNLLRSFWYVTICHELAHNVSPNHDKMHESAMESLLTRTIARF